MSRTLANIVYGLPVQLRAARWDRWLLPPPKPNEFFREVGAFWLLSIRPGFSFYDYTSQADVFLKDSPVPYVPKPVSCPVPPLLGSPTRCRLITRSLPQAAVKARSSLATPGASSKHSKGKASTALIPVIASLPSSHKRAPLVAPESESSSSETDSADDGGSIIFSAFFFLFLPSFLTCLS